MTVETLHQVTDVERAADGRWTVYVDRIDTSGNVLENKILTTNALVMAAGSVGTTKLLVRAASTGRIPDLPDELGTGWGGTNADRIYVWTSSKKNSALRRRPGRLRQFELGRPRHRRHGHPGVDATTVPRRTQHHARRLRRQ